MVNGARGPASPGPRIGAGLDLPPRNKKVRGDVRHGVSRSLTDRTWRMMRLPLVIRSRLDDVGVRGHRAEVSALARQMTQLRLDQEEAAYGKAGLLPAYAAATGARRATVMKHLRPDHDDEHRSGYLPITLETCS